MIFPSPDDYSRSMQIGCRPRAVFREGIAAIEGTVSRQPSLDHWADDLREGSRLREAKGSMEKKASAEKAVREIRESGTSAIFSGCGSQFCDRTQLPSFPQYFHPEGPEPRDGPLRVLHNCEVELRRPGDRMQNRSSKGSVVMAS